jgi:hypothetical protein
MGRNKALNIWIPALRFAAAGMTSHQATIVVFSSSKGEGFQPFPRGKLKGHYHLSAMNYELSATLFQTLAI